MSYHHGDLERAAVERAYDACAAAPHTDLSVRELADALGVTPRAIYRHVEDRRGLLMRVAALSFSKLCDESEATLRACEPSQDARVRLMHTYTRFAVSSPTRYRLMYGMGQDALRGQDALGHQVRRLITLTDHAFAAHEPESSPRERRDRIISSWGMCHGLSDLYFSGTLRAATPAQAISYIVTQLERMLLGGD